MMISSLALYGCVPIITLEDKLASGDYGFFFKTELTADKFYECLLTNKIELKDEFFLECNHLHLSGKIWVTNQYLGQSNHP